MSGYSFIFSKGDIVMTAYGMVLIRHEKTLTIVCQMDWYVRIGMTILGYSILGLEEKSHIMRSYIAIVLRYDNIVSVYCIIIPRV